MSTIAQKKAQLEAQLARLKEQERKLETGQKVILGGWLMNKITNDPMFRRQYLAEIEEATTKRKADAKRIAPFLNDAKALV